jgi:glycosyltransferase involved in cell wall biosynthesis
VRFSVITPCLNPGGLLSDTVESVLSQRAVGSGRVELQYIVIDGGSTDGTIEYLKSNSQRFTWVSESDLGMYDALTKGFAHANGDICSYLNAGDLYHPNAFDVVADVIGRTAGWVTGMAVTHNRRGDIVECWTPYRYRQDFIRCGVYGSLLHFIQQESTFWTMDLMRHVDLSRLRLLQLAGDAYIWRCLSDVVPLTVIEAHLGGFRQHDGHLGADVDGYLREMRLFSDPIRAHHRIQAGLDRLLTLAPGRIRRRFAATSTLSWDGSDWS